MVTLGPIEKLGTVWWFELFSAPAQAAADIERAIITEMDRFEAAYSRFREDSVLTTLNRTGRLAQPTPEFIDLLAIAIDAYQQTGGVFNCTVGGVLEHQGYGLAPAGANRELVPVSEVLAVTPELVTLTPGVHLDFGGFGKGYLIDRLYALLATLFGSHAILINGGGDMYIGGDALGEPVPIGLQHPTESAQVGSLTLAHRGFAVSSPHLRQWQTSDGTQVQHLVGAGVPQAVYVTAPTALWADIWATVVSVAGPVVTVPADVHWWWFDAASNSVRQGHGAD